MARPEEYSENQVKKLCWGFGFSFNLMPGYLSSSAAAVAAAAVRATNLQKCSSGPSEHLGWETSLKCAHSPAAEMKEIETRAGGQALTFIVRDLRLKACYKTITRRFIVRPTWLLPWASVFINMYVAQSGWERRAPSINLVEATLPSMALKFMHNATVPEN